MNAQQLKNAILQEAIEGRLVPQDPNDEPASALLARIRKEKERLVKEGKLKKKDLEVKPISEDEIPFEIPEGWEWVRLGDIVTYQNGYSYNSSETNKERKGVPIIKSGNIMTLDVVVKPNNDYVENPTNKMLASKIVRGDMLMCLSSQSDNPEPLGKTAIYKGDGYALLNQRVLKFRPITDELTSYLYYAINSFYFWYNVSHQGGGSAQANLKLYHVLDMLIPLPPIAEQHRIVSKIEELLPKVEEYGKAQDALNKLNAELPERLKKSILQEAIEGRLVPQDPNDEPASVLLAKIRKEKEQLVKEGKLKKKDLVETPIEENEIPFKIPKSWEWCRLNALCTFLSRGKSPSYSDVPTNYPVFAQKCNLKDGGISLEQARFLKPETVSKWQEEYHLRTDDVLVNSTGTGTVCRTRLFNENCLGKYPFTVPDSHVSVVRTSDNISSAYICFLFNSKLYQDYWEDRLAGSTNQKELYIGVLQNTIIPLPPLAEQKRIVAKIEELFAVLDSIKESLEA